MIVGAVNPDREAIIPLAVRDLNGSDHALDAVIDTGYNGWLTLPPHVIAALGLPWHRLGRATLADGSDVIVNIFRGTVLWDGRPRVIPVDEADSDPLVGMSLIYGYELNVQAVDGGPVSLRQMSP